MNPDQFLRGPGKPTVLSRAPKKRDLHFAHPFELHGWLFQQSKGTPPVTRQCSGVLRAPKSIELEPYGAKNRTFFERGLGLQTHWTPDDARRPWRVKGNPKKAELSYCSSIMLVCSIGLGSASRGTFLILSRNPSFLGNHQNPRGNSRVLKRTMAEKNGESSPRKTS